MAFHKGQDMTHGGNAKPRINSRRKNNSSLARNRSEETKDALKTTLADLEARVSVVEARINQMQGEIDNLSGVAPAHIMEAINGIGKKQRGPEKKIDDTELLLNRDNLVRWLEEHWPMIGRPLLRAKTPSEISAVLSSVAEPLDVRHTWQIGIMDHPADLLYFLRSDKFRRKPPKKTVLDALAVYQSDKRNHAANRLPTRQIANAMAGIPKLKWRSSLDRCSKHPSPYRVGHNTASHYRAAFGIPEET
jgi:hypothetical protein